MVDYKYICDPCEYKTNDRCSWYNHKNSKKHKMIEKIKNYEKKDQIIESGTVSDLTKKQYEIDLLNEKLKASENEKKLIVKQLENIEKQLDETKKKYEKQLDETREQYEKRIEDAKEHIDTLKYENEFQKHMINSAGGMIKKSMNTLNYLLLNYKNAPHITELDDYSIISKSINDLIKNLIYHYNKNLLNKYIGDFIVRQYKKEEPEAQSLWSSDTDRLNYFICEFIKEQNIKNKVKVNNKTQWILDKKGIKMTNYIIKSLLNYIMSINSEYINQRNNEIKTLREDNEQNINKLKEMQTLALINTDIKNNKLSSEINKYIAPFFYFDKNHIV